MPKKTKAIFKQMLKVVCALEKGDPMDVKVEELYARITTLIWELNDKDRKIFSRKWPNVVNLLPSEWSPRLRFNIKMLHSSALTGF